MTSHDRERAQRSGHIGLALVEERVDKLDGTMTIGSAPDKGTRVVISVPTPRS